MSLFYKIIGVFLCRPIKLKYRFRFYTPEKTCINPLVPSAANMRRSAKILILILEGIIKKNSDERRDYESVDKKNTYLSLCPEKLWKKEFRQ